VAGFHLLIGGRFYVLTDSAGRSALIAMAIRPHVLGRFDDQ